MESGRNYSMFTTWMLQTRMLQEQYYKVVPGKLEGNDFAQWVMFNALAAHSEISEAMQLLNWKPWKNDRGRPDSVDTRAAVAEELVDALHFIANMLVSLNVSDEELNAIYLSKMEVNRNRQRERWVTGSSGVGISGVTEPKQLELNLDGAYQLELPLGELLQPVVRPVDVDVEGLQ